jgi:hypothetical protein
VDLLQMGTNGGLGISPSSRDVFAIAGIPCVVGQVVEFDLASSNALVNTENQGSASSGMTVVVAPTATGIKYGRVHGICLKAAATGTRVPVRLFGIQMTYVKRGDGTITVAKMRRLSVGTDGYLHADQSVGGGERIKGLALEAVADASAAVLVPVLFDGIRGFTQHVEATVSTSTTTATTTIPPELTSPNPFTTTTPTTQTTTTPEASTTTTTTTTTMFATLGPSGLDGASSGVSVDQV